MLQSSTVYSIDTEPVPMNDVKTIYCDILGSSLWLTYEFLGDPRQVLSTSPRLM